MENNKIKIYTLGCKVNQYDSNNLRKKLNSIGFKFVNEDADFAIINTCAVTASAISKSRKMLNKARNENPKAEIILTGCWPKAYKKEVKSIKGINYIFSTGEENKIIKFLKIENKLNLSLSSHAKFTGNRCRYFIKIQDGCEQFCSYCIIPFTRGKLKSRDELEIIEEIEAAIRNGYEEIVLSGIHLGLYGIDKKTNLIDLLNKIFKIENLGRIRLSSIEPMEVNVEIISLMEKSRKMCRHLHIPLQSGNDKILKLMNRPYTLNRFKEKIKQIRRQIPNIAISTDIIVGFPGETSKDFQKTYNLIKKMKFSHLHVFSFSAHEKTPAYNLTNKVDQKEIERRSKLLRDLGKKLENDFIKKTTSKLKEFEVIVEKKIGDKYIGKTEYYFDLKFKNINIKEKVQNKNYKGKLIIIDL